MKKKLSRRDAEVIMGMAGLLTILELADMEDFIELMFEIEDYIDMASSDHIDYITALLSSIHEDIDP